MARFQVFISKQNDAKSKFSAPWYWIASMYVSIFWIDGNYCRIDDTKSGKTMLEWVRAKPLK